MTKSITKKAVSDTVKITKRGATVQSDKVAKIFGKAHSMILRKIRGVCDELVMQNCTTTSYFIPSNYINSKGKDYTRYELTRKGFDLLGLSLTGKEAFKFKLWYIDEFHKKSDVIQKNKQLAYENNENPLWLEFRAEGKEIRTKLTDAIQDYLLPQRVEEGKETSQFVARYITVYTNLIYKLLDIEVPKGTALNRDAMGIRVLMEIERKETQMAMDIEFLAKDGMHYKDIYKRIKEIKQSQL